MGIDKKTFGPILVISLTEFHKRLGTADSALQAGDFSGLALNAHTMKSTAATIGAAHCQKLAIALERAAIDRRADEARTLLDRLQGALCAVRAAVERP